MRRRGWLEVDERKGRRKISTKKKKKKKTRARFGKGVSGSSSV